MNESDYRDLLLVQAYETTPNSAWSTPDRQWACETAQREAGADAPANRYLACRARLAATRLRDRDPLARGLSRASRWPGSLGWLLALGGLLLGLGAQTAGANQYINLLAAPLLLLLAWNLLVFAAIALGRLLGSDKRKAFLAARWRRLLQRLVPVHDAAQAGVLARFVRLLSPGLGPLAAARLSGSLHAAAACVAIGAIAILYLRGLVFEYRAGWASTFLNAEQVQVLLQLIYAPASWLSGVGLPDIDRIAAMRMPSNPGERAGNWIHLQAATLSFAVILPRLALSFVAALRARKLAAALSPASGDAYIASLLRTQRAQPARVRIIPYGLTLHDAEREQMAAMLAGVFGATVQVQFEPGTGFGQDRVDGLPNGPLPDWTAVLFRLASTPEREVQLRFVDSLLELLPTDAPLAIVLDDSSFRARIDDPARLEQRVAAWRRMFADRACPIAVVSLHADRLDQGVSALIEATEIASGAPG